MSSANDHELSRAEKSAYGEMKLSLITVSMATVGVMTYPIFLVLTAPLIAFIWRDSFVGAYRSVFKERRISADIVYALTTIVALATGYIFASALISVIFGVSRILLIKTQNQSRSSLVDVFVLQSHTAWVLKDDSEIEVPLHEVHLDDIIVIHAGESIAVDGEIVDGIASVDQHILTGEAQPAEKEVDDNVFASTTVLTGRIQVRVLKTGQETTAAQIIDILNHTVDYRTTIATRSEGLIDQLAIPVLGLGALAFVTVGPAGALAVLNSNMMFSILVVSPLSMLNFLNLASQRGILVKDGRALELLCKVDTVVFDKTGTLTQNMPHVGGIHIFADFSEQELLGYAAAAEYRQTHPIAKTILNAARAQAVVPPGH